MSSQAWYTDRVKEELSRKISQVITQRLRDPRIPPVVTLTQITLAADSRNATVYVSVFGSENEIKGCMIALQRAAPFIQRVVSGSMRIRRFPKLYFKLDRSLQHAQHINELLEQVRDDLEETTHSS